MSPGAQVATPSLDEFEHTYQLLGCEKPLGEAWPGASTILARENCKLVNLLVLSEAASWDSVLSLFYYLVTLKRCQVDFAPSLMLLPQAALQQGTGTRWCLCTACVQLQGPSASSGAILAHSGPDQLISACVQVAACLSELHQHSPPVAMQDFAWVLLRMQLSAAEVPPPGAGLPTGMVASKTGSESDPGPAELQRRTSVKHAIIEPSQASQSDTGHTEQTSTSGLFALPLEPSLQHHQAKQLPRQNSPIQDLLNGSLQRQRSNSNLGAQVQRQPSSSNLSNTLQRQDSTSFQREQSSSLQKQAAILAATMTTASETVAQVQSQELLPSKVVESLQRKASQQLHLADFDDTAEVTLPASAIQAIPRPAPSRRASRLSSALSCKLSDVPDRPRSMNDLGLGVAHLAHVLDTDDCELTTPFDNLRKAVMASRSVDTSMRSKVQSSSSLADPLETVKTLERQLSRDAVGEACVEPTVRRKPARRPSCLSNSHSSKQGTDAVYEALDTDEPRGSSSLAHPLEVVKTLERQLSRDAVGEACVEPTVRRKPVRRPSLLSNSNKQGTDAVSEALDEPRASLSTRGHTEVGAVQATPSSPRRLPARSASCSPAVMSTRTSISSLFDMDEPGSKTTLEAVKSVHAVAADPDSQVTPTPPPRRRPSVVRTASRLSCSSNVSTVDVQPLHCALSSQSTLASSSGAAYDACEDVRDPDLATLRAASSSSTARRQIKRCSSRLSISTSSSMDIVGDKPAVPAKVGAEGLADVWDHTSNSSFRATSTSSVHDLEAAMLQDPDLLPPPLVPYRRTPTRSSSRLSLGTSNAGVAEPPALIARAGGSSGSSSSKKGAASISLAAALLSNVAVARPGSSAYGPVSCPVLPSTSLAARFSDLPEVSLPPAPARPAPVRSTSRLSLASGSNSGLQQMLSASHSFSGRAGPVKRPSRLCITTNSGNKIGFDGPLEGFDYEGESGIRATAAAMARLKAWGPPSCPAGKAGMLQAHAHPAPDSDPPSSGDLTAAPSNEIASSATATLVERMRAAAANSMPSPVLKQQMPSPPASTESMTHENQDAPQGRRQRMKRRCSVSFNVVPAQYSNLEDVSALTARSSEPISTSDTSSVGYAVEHGQALHPALVTRRLPSRTSSRLSLACSAHSSLAGHEQWSPASPGSKPQPVEPADTYEALIESLKHGAYDMVLAEQEALLTLGPLHLIPGLAPEMRASGACPTVEGDVFTFGILLYQAFDGSPALSLGGGRDALAAKLGQGWRPDRPSAITDDDLWHLITACWAADPKQRPSMAQVQATLQNLVKQGASSATLAGLLHKPSSGGALTSKSIANLGSDVHVSSFDISQPLAIDPPTPSRRSKASSKAPSKAPTDDAVETGNENDIKVKTGCVGCTTCAIM